MKTSLKIHVLLSKKKHSPIIVRLTMLFLVWAILKSTRHLYTPVSESLAFCTANSPGNLSNKKYARLANTVSSDHRFAAFGSLSRMSTLLEKLQRKNGFSLAAKKYIFWNERRKMENKTSFISLIPMTYNKSVKLQIVYNLS